jgi:hypothetical protein
MGIELAKHVTCKATEPPIWVVARSSADGDRTQSPAIKISHLSNFLGPLYFFFQVVEELDELLGAVAW